VLNGITVDDLQKMVNVRPGPSGRVFVFDEELIGPDGRANPALLAPPTTPGELGQFVYLYGPGLWTTDLGISKQFATGGPTRLNFEALLINAFNHRNPLVGGRVAPAIRSTRRRSARPAGTRSARVRCSSGSHSPTKYRQFPTLQRQPNGIESWMLEVGS
jgi:hypothetical protein